MNVFIFLVDPLSLFLSLFVPDRRRLARKRSIFFSLSIIAWNESRRGILLRWRGKEGGVGSHVRPWTRRYGATAIVNQLWLFRARERDTTLWVRGLFRPGRMEDKNVSENKLTLLGSPVIGFWGQEIVCYRGTCRPCILFLFFFCTRAPFFFSLSLCLFFFCLFFFRRSRCIKTNERDINSFDIESQIQSYMNKSIYIYLIVFKRFFCRGNKSRIFLFLFSFFLSFVLTNLSNY